MTKTLSLTISLAIAVVGFAAAAAPTYAATRLMSSSFEGFEYRCENHGGSFAQDGSLVSCQTPTVPVECEYFSDRQAVCSWPGIVNQISVIRVIGTLPAGYVASLGESDEVKNGGGGGIVLDGPQDFVDVPDSDPKPNFEGPNDFQMAP